MAVETLDQRLLEGEPELAVSLRHVGSVCVLSLRGDLHAGSVGVLERQFDRLGRTPCRRVVIDLAELRHIDEIGARVLTGIRHYIRARGGRLSVIGTSESVAAALAEA